MGKAALIHDAVDQGRLFICAGGMLYAEKIGGILQKFLVIIYNNIIEKNIKNLKFSTNFLFFFSFFNL